MSNNFRGGVNGTSLVNNAVQFLGPVIPNDKDMRVNDKKAYVNYDLRDAYTGDNDFVRSRLDDKILEDEQFYTTLLLPYHMSDEMYFEFNTFKFNHVLAGEVPNEGISRLVTTSMESGKKTTIRKGLAFQMEFDFYDTDKGRQAYYQNIEGISACVIETTHYDIMFAIFNAKNGEQTLAHSYRYHANKDKARLDDQKNQYAVLLTGFDAFANLVSRYKSIMTSRKCAPNIIVGAPGIGLYADSTRIATTYWSTESGEFIELSGPVSNFSVLGIPYFETRDFDVREDSYPPIELCCRPSIVSEFYPMTEGNEFRIIDPSTYDSDKSSIAIYSENTDRLEKITRKEALINARVFDDRSGDYSEELINQLDIFNTSGNVLPKGNADEDGYDEEGVGCRIALTQPNTENFHFLFTQGIKQTAGLSKYFGQFHSLSLSTRYLRLMSECGKYSCYHDINKLNKILFKARTLINNIQNQSVSDKYIRSLYKANLVASIDTDGTFIGETTASDLIPFIGSANVVTGWKTNAYGSPYLPKDVTETYPAGFSDWPHLKTLALEADDEKSCFQKPGVQAREIVIAIEEMAENLRRINPTSELFQVENRSPWYSATDPVAVFFSNAIGRTGDPMFMGFVKPRVDGAGNLVKTKQRTPTASDKNSEELEYFYTPLFTPEDFDVNNPVESLKDHLRSTFGKIPANFNNRLKDDMKNGLYYYKSPSTGTSVTIPKKLIEKGAMNSEEIRIFSLLGDQTSVSLIAAYSNLSTEMKLQNLSTPAGQARFEEVIEARKTLTSTLYSLTIPTVKTSEKMVKTRLRKFVSALPSNVNDLIQTLESCKSGGDKASNDKAKAFITDLIKKSTYDPNTAPDNDIITAPINEPSHEDKTLSESKAKIAKSVTTVVSLTSDINAYLSSEDIDPIHVSFMDAAKTNNDFDNAIASLQNPTSKTDATAKAAIIARQLGRIAKEAATLYPDINDTQKRTDYVESEVRGSSTDIDIGDFDGANATFYRIGIINSPKLMESISALGVKCMLRPSNPSTNHTTPFMLNAALRGQGTARFPKELMDRYRRSNINSDFLNSQKLHHLSFLDETRRVSNGKTVDDEYNYVNEVANYDPSQDMDMSSNEEENLSSDRLAQFLSNAYFRDRYDKVCHFPDLLSRAIGLVLIFTTCNNKKSWSSLYDNNIPMPIGFLIKRLFIEHDMLSLFLARGGSELGSCLIGKSNFVLGQDATIKMFLGNYTYHEVALIWAPENIEIINNVKPARYAGGHNTKWIRNPADAFLDNQDRPSMISVAIPCTETNFPSVVNFNGESQEDYNEKLSDGTVIPSYSTFKFYNRIYGYSNDRSDPKSATYFDEGETSDFNSMQGLFYSYNYSTGSIDKENKGKGMLNSRLIYPGCAAIWNGTVKFTEKMNGMQIRV